MASIDDIINGILNSSKNGTGLTNFSASTSKPFEQFAAKLVPFDLALMQQKADKSHALWPIIQTGGLVFPFNPTISEGVNVKYNSMEMVHSNESYNVYQATENVHITLANCTWVCDTFANAIYTLAVLHFLRSYSLMDFGKARSLGAIRGRPPSPMWFSAFGSYAFNQVPVLYQRADWTFPDDIDYVGVPEPGSSGWNSCQLVSQGSPNAMDSVTWLPIKFVVSSISLIVQHAPRYWINWSLDDFRSGNMLNRTPNHSFHDIMPPAALVDGKISSATSTPSTTGTTQAAATTFGSEFDV